jgi:hypothetical protein
MTRGLLRLALALALAASIASLGCAGERSVAYVGGVDVPADPSEAPDDAPDPRATIDVQRLAREVAELRQVKLTAPVRARPLADAAFRERLFAGRGAPTGAAGEHGASTRAFWTGFGFAPPASSVGDTARRVLEEQIVGFYDAEAKTLFVRGGGDGTRIVPRRANDREVLVHEIEHALQDQNFGLRSDTAGVDDDALLARAAVYEGDAMLTTLAERAVRMPAAEHWVSRVTEILRSHTPEQLVEEAGEHSSELSSAPPLLRRRIVFPYYDGLTLMADLYRAGGLPLIDRAFSHLPRTTEQVLHPEKYVAGEPPVPVKTPSAPPGWRAAASGTMGELQTAVLLGQCVSADEARAAAQGWGGDAYAILVGPQGSVGELWTTAWDDEEAADRFQRAVAARATCLRDAALDDRVGRDVVVTRDGKRVGYAQGFAALGDRMARGLVALVGEPPPAEPPFGDVTIPPLLVPEEVFGHRGKVEGGGWASSALGMSLPLPPGFRADPQGPLELLVRHPKTGSLAGFSVLMQSAGARLEKAYVKDVIRGLRASDSLARQALSYEGTSSMAVGGATARAYTWQASRGARVRIAFAPACDGKATVVLILVWAGRRGWIPLGDWLGGFALPARDSPACTYLRQVVD